ncbi:hypothetical protein X733_31225 [Mesorhizobium sp. L2C067A000]|nr:hypothetical protein X733_31225 [Mesorhizobium sp. L2C067A000]
MAVLWVADVGGAVVGLALDPFERCRHSPKQVGDFTLPVCRIADHRTGLVGISMDGSGCLRCSRRALVHWRMASCDVVILYRLHI